jgi:peptidoglycan/LPS O-acetylase OafA/YrhL
MSTPSPAGPSGSSGAIAAEESVHEPVDDRLAHGYLHQVDVVRLLTFGSVIAVHVIASTTGAQDATARGTLMLLHFTRETFFVITGFVLFHSGYPRGGRTVDLPRFWRRRFLLIGVPYVVWSLVYWWQASHADLHVLAVQLITGTAQYHLYFLLVSMQVYLVFGLLVALVRATSGHQGRLLAAATVFQLALFWLLHDVLPSWRPAPAWVTTLAGYAQQLLPSYLAYVLAGALAAVHLRRVQGWVLRHGRVIAVAVAAGALLTEGAYLLQVRTGTPPYRAADVLQPVMVGWTVLVTAGLFWLGLRYAERRRGGVVSRAVGEGARISFGVFLVHPLAISLLLASPLAGPLGRAGQPWLAAGLWVLTVLASVAAVEVVARTPLSLPLTGRRRQSGTRDRRTPAVGGERTGDVQVAGEARAEATQAGRRDRAAARGSGP